MVVGQGLGATTGFALNPARDWSPRLAYTILPVPNKSSANWQYAWVPMCGPIVGGLLASALQYFLKHEKNDELRYEDHRSFCILQNHSLIFTTQKQ